MYLVKLHIFSKIDASRSSSLFTVQIIHFLTDGRPTEQTSTHSAGRRNGVNHLQHTYRTTSVTKYGNSRIETDARTQEY